MKITINLQRFVSMNFEDPLFNIHLNVDYPFTLTGILFFPKIKNDINIQKDKIQLFQNQVFVTDNVEGIVPEFLTLLRGVIDSPDIPLNVSRSYLQVDSAVKKISNYITRKVGDKLNSLIKKDRKKYEEKWNDIKIIIEYGMLSEDKFFEKSEASLFTQIQIIIFIRSMSSLRALKKVKPIRTVRLLFYMHQMLMNRIHILKQLNRRI